MKRKAKGVKGWGDRRGVFGVGLVSGGLDRDGILWRRECVVIGGAFFVGFCSGSACRYPVRGRDLLCVVYLVCNFTKWIKC